MSGWNPDKAFKVTPSLPISANDDFAGVDGSLPNPLRWDTSGIGDGSIQSNNYYSDDSSYITSRFSISGDFDVEVELEDILHTAAKSWEIRIKAIIDSSNYLHFGLGYTGTACSTSAKAYFGYKQVAGVLAENGCVLTSNNIGRVKITRVGTICQTYYLNSSGVWTALGSSVSMGVGNVTFCLESVKWDTFPTYQVSVNYFIVNSGTIVWPILGSLSLDPYWENVSFAFPFEGNNYTNIFTDISPRPKTLSATGDLRLNSAQSKFGTTSLYFDGNGDFGRSLYHSDLDFIATDFTIECWVYPTFSTNASGRRIASVGGGTVGWNGSNGIHWLLQLDVGEVLNFKFWNGSTTETYSTTGTVSKNVWTYIAVCKTPLHVFLFIGGTCTAFSCGDPVRPTVDGRLDLGAINGDYGNSATVWAGFMDQLKITKGVARYTANFTPPTIPVSQYVYLDTVQLPFYLSSGSGLTNFDASAVFDDIGINNKKIAIMVEGGDECPIEIPPDSWDAVNKTAMILATIPGLTSATILQFYYDSLHDDNPNVIDVDPLPDPPTDPYELAVYNLGLDDGFWTWSEAVAAQLVTMLLDQPVALLHLVSMALDQPISFPVRMILDQPCGDSATVSMILDQWVRDLATVKMVLDQSCGDAKTVRMILDQPVSFPAKVTMVLDQPVALGGQLVTMVLDQPMALLGTFGMVKMILDQPCSLADEQAIINHISITVTVGGRTVDPDYISLRVDDQDAFITSTIRFPDYAQYASCKVGDEVIIIEAIAGGSTESTILQVQSLTNPEEPGAADHVITAISPTIVLDDEPISEDLGPGIVDVLLADLCARYGINLAWQGVANWPVLTNELVAADETPLAVLKRVADVSGSYLQSLPDGSLRLLPDYQVSTEAWPAANTFTLHITDQDHIFTIDEQADPRDGYNAFLVSGQSASSDKYRLEETAISSTTKEISCYIVPWDSVAGVVLDHTGGDWVSIDSLGGSEEAIESEQIEIVAGIGTASYPIYALSAYRYLQDSLGAISWSEDGSIQTEVVGDALIEIDYTTRHLSWLVTDPRAESLQLYIKEVA